MPDNVDTNLLRYEFRVKSGLAKIVGYPVVTVADLIDERFYKLMRQLWYNSYKSIDKLSYTSAAVNIKNIPEWKNYLILDSIEKSGVPGAFDLIDGLHSQVSSQTRYKMKRIVKALISNKVVNDVNDAVAELDSKMLNVYQFAA